MASHGSPKNYFLKDLPQHHYNRIGIGRNYGLVEITHNDIINEIGSKRFQGCRVSIPTNDPCRSMPARVIVFVGGHGHAAER